MTDKDPKQTQPAPSPEDAAKASYKINMTLTRKGRNRLIWLGLVIGAASGLTAVAYRLALQGLEKLRAEVIPGLNGPWPVFFYFAVLLLLGFIVCLLVKSEPLIKGSGIPQVEGQLQGYFNPRWLRVLLGGGLVVILTLLLGTTDYNGAGLEVLTRAVQGRAVPTAFLLKIIFTAITLRAGYKGGEIVPTFFVGATFGCVVGPLLGLHPSFAAAAGMVAVFCGVTNCPLTSLLLGYELFAGVGLAPMALTIATAYMLSGYCGLYHEQLIMYSKTKSLFIHQNAGEAYTRETID